MTLLAADGLAHVLARRRILELAQFAVEPGGHMLVMGPSGSGKTTLINILAGLTTPTAGEVLLDGQAFSSLSPRRRDRRRRLAIGLVFQTLRLISALTVRQNLALAQRVARGRVDTAAVAGLLTSLGLTDRADVKPRSLSQGERQRAAIARALCARPALLIADEPTSALDDENAARVTDLLLSSAEQNGATLIVATHDHRIRDRFAHSITLHRPIDGGGA